jgi:hypothetical protein
MLKNPWFKLACRIACLAILTSAALWLNAPVHASFTCVISVNDKTGAFTYLSCGTSAGDVYWHCPAGQGYCDSDPANDWQAGQDCAQYASTGCPQTEHYIY